MKTRALVRDMAAFMRQVNPQLAAALIGGPAGRGTGTGAHAHMPHATREPAATLPPSAVGPPTTTTGPHHPPPAQTPTCHAVPAPCADERDEIMTRALLRLEGRAVGVVGLAHMDGIERRWEEAMGRQAAVVER